MNMKVICDDPEAEHQAPDAIVAGLEERQGLLATPAEGWAIRDQIAHLACIDEADRLAIAAAAPGAAGVYGRFCHGAGGHEGGERCRRVLVLATLYAFDVLARQAAADRAQGGLFLTEQERDVAA